MKKTYDFKNILEQYNFDNKNELFNYLRKNSKNGEINLIRANLSYIDLSRVNFFKADLFHANFSNADLSYAIFCKADLSHANFSNADLTEADLSGANLFHADLTEADLFRANLFKTRLTCANLTGANIDLSIFMLSCDTVSAKLDKKHAVQLLYHAAMPFQNNKLEIDEDLKELFNSDLFKKVVNKFHRIGNDCIEFHGVK